MSRELRLLEAIARHQYAQDEILRFIVGALMTHADRQEAVILIDKLNLSHETLSAALEVQQNTTTGQREGDKP